MILATENLKSLEGVDNVSPFGSMGTCHRSFVANYHRLPRRFQQVDYFLRVKRNPAGAADRRAALVPSNRVLTFGTSVYVADVAYDRRRTRSRAGAMRIRSASWCRPTVSISPNVVGYLPGRPVTGFSR